MNVGEEDDLPLARGHHSWLRESISDDNGLADIAYVSLFMVGGSILSTILFICAMAVWSFGRCVEKLDAAAPVLCRFDPLPIGQSVGLIVAGGFSSALAALAAYMLATRKPAAAITPAPTTTTRTNVATETTTAP